MKFERKGGAFMESMDGYRVSRVRVADDVKYVAWAPDIGFEAVKRMMRVRYARGERVPARRELIGVATTAAEAMEMCEQHASGVRDAG